LARFWAAEFGEEAGPSPGLLPGLGPLLSQSFGGIGMLELRRNGKSLDRTVAVTFSPLEEEREALKRLLGPGVCIVYLKDCDEVARRESLGKAEVLFCNNFSISEISAEEVSCLKELKFIQTLFAGVDKTPFENLPQGVKMASNAGAFAGPVSEHAMALALTCAKRIFPKSDLMRGGRFDRTPTNRQLSEGLCAIIGFGGIGKALAPKMRALGMEIHAVNRSGGNEDGADRFWSLSEIDALLPLADLTFLSIPLTLQTRGLINRRRLEIMKKDAILVNVARAPIIVRVDLLEHLKANPQFFFGGDVWWREPEGDEALISNDPLFELPNVVPTPHNADRVQGADLVATENASENIRRYLDGQPPQCIVNPRDYMV
jgi:phosphoglycerate dehydrogenase-like enzyme